MLFEKLPPKDVDCMPHQKRVLEFNPINVPNLFKVQPFKRFQSISIKQLFPKNSKRCGCGCGKQIVGRRTRWATDDCERFAVAVRLIIYGSSETIARYMRIYHGWKCQKCGCEDKGHDMGYNGIVAWIKVDHIIPVKLGGGACWLSNYQLLCHDCHVNKTNKDFKWKHKVELPSLFPKALL